MKAKTLTVFLAYLLFLAMAACSPQAGSLDIQVVPATQAVLDTANLDELQPVVMAFINGISDDRRSFYQFQSSTCALPEVEQTGPTCIAGEQSGAAVKVFPIGGKQHSFLRPEEIGQILDWYGEDLYAVYRTVPDKEPKGYWPSGEYGLIFDRAERGLPSPIVAIVQDGRVVRLDVFPGSTPVEILNDIPAGQVVLPPSEAKTWSTPLKGLTLVSQTTSDPQGAWEAHTMLALPTEGGEKYFRRLAVTNREGDPYWKVMEEWAPYGAGYTAPFPFLWSQKQAVLYWTNTLTPEGCAVFSNGTDLHRLDLETGVSTQVLGPVGQWLAISPDETRVAAAVSGQLELYTLATEERSIAALPEGQPGQIVWSWDGKGLVLTLAHNPCAEDSTYSILRVEPETMAVKTLIDHDPRRFASLEWPAVGPVLLADKDGNPWQMDPDSGEVWQEGSQGSEQKSGTTAISGWVGKQDFESMEDRLLGGVIVRLGNFSLRLAEGTSTYARSLISLAHDQSSAYRPGEEAGWLERFGT